MNGDTRLSGCSDRYTLLNESMPVDVDCSDRLFDIDINRLFLHGLVYLSRLRRELILLHEAEPA